MHLHTDAYLDRHQRLVADAAARRLRTRPTVVARLLAMVRRVPAPAAPHHGPEARPAAPGLTRDWGAASA
jgi:hypothetical protein